MKTLKILTVLFLMTVLTAGAAQADIVYYDMVVAEEWGGGGEQYGYATMEVDTIGLTATLSDYHGDLNWDMDGVYVELLFMGSYIHFRDEPFSLYDLSGAGPIANWEVGNAMELNSPNVTGNPYGTLQPYGSQAPEGAGVPEPATVVGLSLMVIAAGLRRMRKSCKS